MTAVESGIPGSGDVARKGAPREYAEIVLVCVILLIFARTFVLQQSEIPTGSMQDTILIGDHIIVNRFAYAGTSFDWERRWLPIREIDHGDVVVFSHPPEPELDYIKRVVGLPGDVVELREGFLYVNGRPVDEPYVTDTYRRADPRKDFGPVQVLPGHYYVLGDRRDQSMDSRFWEQVPRESLRGRALLVLFSTRRGAAEDPGRVTPRSLMTKLYDVLFHARWERFLRVIR